MNRILHGAIFSLSETLRNERYFWRQDTAARKYFLYIYKHLFSKLYTIMSVQRSTCGRIRRDKATTWPISPVLNCGLNGCFAFCPWRLIYVREMPPLFHTLLAGWSSVLFSLRPQKRLSNLVVTWSGSFYDFSSQLEILLLNLRENRVWTSLIKIYHDFEFQKGNVKKIFVKKISHGNLWNSADYEKLQYFLSKHQF